MSRDGTDEIHRAGDVDPNAQVGDPLERERRAAQPPDEGRRSRASSVGSSTMGNFMGGYRVESDSSDEEPLPPPPPPVQIPPFFRPQAAIAYGLQRALTREDPVDRQRAAERIRNVVGPAQLQHEARAVSNYFNNALSTAVDPRNPTKSKIRVGSIRVSHQGTDFRQISPVIKAKYPKPIKSADPNLSKCIHEIVALSRGWDLNDAQLKLLLSQCLEGGPRSCMDKWAHLPVRELFQFILDHFGVADTPRQLESKFWGRRLSKNVNTMAKELDELIDLAIETFYNDPLENWYGNLRALILPQMPGDSRDIFMEMEERRAAVCDGNPLLAPGEENSLYPTLKYFKQQVLDAVRQSSGRSSGATHHHVPQRIAAIHFGTNEQSTELIPSSMNYDYGDMYAQSQPAGGHQAALPAPTPASQASQGAVPRRNKQRERRQRAAQRKVENEQKLLALEQKVQQLSVAPPPQQPPPPRPAVTYQPPQKVRKQHKQPQGRREEGPSPVRIEIIRQVDGGPRDNGPRVTKTGLLLYYPYTRGVRVIAQEIAKVPFKSLYNLKQPSVPEGEPLPYRVENNCYQPMNPPLDFPIFRAMSNPEEGSPSRTRELLQWAETHCFKCGEAFCSAFDKRCIYADKPDSWSPCLCRQGFHCDKDCLTGKSLNRNGQ